TTSCLLALFFFFQAEDGIRDGHVTGVQTCALPISAGDAPVYGINTGFGLLANTRIAPAQRTLLQRNIILSHSAGVGPLLDDAIRSEERRVGKECRSRGAREHWTKKAESRVLITMDW